MKGGVCILEEHLGYLQCHFELWHACDSDGEEDHHRVLFSFFLSYSNNFLKQKVAWHDRPVKGCLEQRGFLRLL